MKTFTYFTISVAFISAFGCAIAQVPNHRNPSQHLPNAGAGSNVAYVPSSTTLIQDNWEQLKEWKSLNEEKYNLIVDYRNTPSHKMVFKGRVPVNNVAPMLENKGLATFRVSFTLLVECTPEGFTTSFSSITFDFYISSAPINYNDLSLDEMDALRDELLAFMQLRRRYGNPIPVDESFASGRLSSATMSSIYACVNTLCDNIISNLTPAV